MQEIAVLEEVAKLQYRSMLEGQEHTLVVHLKE